jgi:1L-myo-inositol 1-phosphate cytidylyltransferase / CDP-L-myo-inositol myo-inositolphosphotransferase
MALNGSGPLSLTPPGRRQDLSRPASSPLLVIVPHEADGSGPPLRWTVVGGLPLVRRVALAARRAGFEQVVLAGARPEDQLLLAGTGATALTRAADVPRVRGRVVLLADCVVPQPAWLEHLAQLPLAPGQLSLDGALAAVVDAREDSRVPVVATRGGAAATVFAAVRPGLEAVEAPIDPAGRFVMSSPADAAAAETWLLRALIKPHETFVSRHFERRLSLALTRRLARTSLTPNAMSLIMIGAGLLGAPCFLSASPGWQVTGALLFLLHSVLDGCDGELARLKYLESASGARLDFWGDNIVHSAVFACLALGWSLSIGAGWPLLLGAWVVGSTLAAAAAVRPDTSSARLATHERSASRRLVESLANRNFIYLVLLLAVAARAWWILVPAAIGTPIFLTLALWARWADRAAVPAGGEVAASQPGAYIGR